jgi:NAD(P)-dependent dehydrogenase (short-subunit alcohol dehydrogenase family)|tara:strand:+ start:70 stop:615 length:546 start_codon:yes stop_codon:yes gene_type:complete
MILILGKSTIAKELESALPNSIVVGKPEYNFSNRHDCNRVVMNYNPDVVINTFALGPQADDVWDQLTVNFTSMVYLTDLFYKKLQDAHIINFSSTSTYWSSYPGIDDGRFFYNLSKTCLSTFGKLYNRKIVDEARNVVTTFETGKFNSKIHNWSGGMPIERVVHAVKDCIDKRYTQIALIR